jgi:lipopolysaccharide/colanic/teichoic acid biosynthesis glycosyltransferase
MLHDSRQAAAGIPRQAAPQAPASSGGSGDRNAGDRNAVAGSRAVATRALDVALTVASAAVTGPALAVGWLLAWSSSPGPGLFRQERIGRDGEPFTMLKLRTMRVNCDDEQHRAYVRGMLSGEQQDGSQEGMYKLTADPRVTPVGAFLRKTSLDELPQLINVLRGDMSLVGPRPALPWETEMFRPSDRLRFAVRPGITGLWQVSGRSRLSMRQALDLDVEFVHRYSLSQYLGILVRTGPALLKGGAS